MDYEVYANGAAGHLTADLWMQIFRCVIDSGGAGAMNWCLPVCRAWRQWIYEISSDRLEIKHVEDQILLRNLPEGPTGLEICVRNRQATLKILSLDFGMPAFSYGRVMPVVTACSRLEHLKLSPAFLMHTVDVSGLPKGLTHLQFNERVLVLGKIPDLPNLECLCVSLQRRGYRDPLEVSHLTNLKRLELLELNSEYDLPNIKGLTQLTHITAYRLPVITPRISLDWLRSLPALEGLHFMEVGQWVVEPGIEQKVLEIVPSLRVMSLTYSEPGNCRDLAFFSLLQNPSGAITSRQIFEASYTWNDRLIGQENPFQTQFRLCRSLKVMNSLEGL